MQTPNMDPVRRVSAQALLAALKSLALPGLGQWHNGELNKAAWWFLAFALVSVPGVAFVALYLPPAWTVPTLALGLLLGLGLWLGSALDAWRVARRTAPLPAAQTPFWRLGGVTALILVACDFVLLPQLVAEVRAHQVQPFRIPSASMSPTLQPGDFVFADMRYACIGCRRPVRRGDVVIFANPDDRTMLYVKRVVALPGDRVQVEGDEVRVNGSRVSRGLVAAPTLGSASVAEPSRDFVVEPGRIFALGDNAAHSLDSRQFGPVPLSEIVGRVRQVWFSWGEGGVRWARLGKLIE